MRYNGENGMGNVLCYMIIQYYVMLQPCYKHLIYNVSKDNIKDSQSSPQNADETKLKGSLWITSTMFRFKFRMNSSKGIY